jgi:hypothetical protein
MRPTYMSWNSASSRFKSSFLHSLRASLSANLLKYQRDQAWTREIGAAAAREMQTEVVIPDVLALHEPKNGNLMDIENAIRLHGALRHLTPLQARDPRLWTHLAHVECWQYMRKRWPIERHLSRRERAARFVLSRYFVPQSQSRALLRNGIARLWWTAQMSYDSDRDNPYELTAVLLSTLDITQQILERGIGRAPNVILAFLEFLLRSKEVLLAGGNENRARIRRLAKFLNLHGGVSILDCLSKAEVIDLLQKEFSRIATTNNQVNEPVADR